MSNMSLVKKIGLITIYHVPNYGSVLQTYATQELIKRLGCECVVLRYRYPNDWHCKLDPQRCKKSFILILARLLWLTPNIRKFNKLVKFRKKKLNFSREYVSLDDLRGEDWKDYFAVIVGSDQVWNYRYTLADSAFMLSFLPEGKYRFSFASSFAQKTISDSVLREKYRKYLSKFSALSVRENNGISIISDELQLNKSVTVVLDPTLLLSATDWLNILPRSRFVKKRKYILLYLLTYAFESRPYVFEVLQYLKNKYNYDIIALEGYTPKEKALGIDMIDMRDSSIYQYIDLFENADMIVTTSFHGTAFALNFGKPLVSIVPDDKGDDRQMSLMHDLGVENCIVNVGNNLQDINPFYDVKLEQDRLCQLRNKSINWLIDKLEKE